MLCLGSGLKPWNPVNLPQCLPTCQHAATVSWDVQACQSGLSAAVPASTLPSPVAGVSVLLQACTLLLVSPAQQHHVLQHWEERAAVQLTDTVKISDASNVAEM